MGTGTFIMLFLSLFLALLMNGWMDVILLIWLDRMYPILRFFLSSLFAFLYCLFAVRFYFIGSNQINKVWGLPRTE
jgi:hypothetical protein